MRITLDPTCCDGFGFCAEILPELIDLDEWGYPIVGGAEIPQSLLGAARYAVRSCPRRALALTQEVALSTAPRSPAPR
jgi:ferredoxin